MECFQLAFKESSSGLLPHLDFCRLSEYRLSRVCPGFLKGTIAWDFRTLFFHKLVPSTQSPDSHSKIFSSSVAISLSYWHFKKKICMYKTRKFLNLRVLYMEIFESVCIETRRLENMNSFALQNLRVSIHKDFWNTAIKFCIKKFKIPILKAV